MSTIAHPVRPDAQGDAFPPLLVRFEEGLATYIGVLSKFIVKRQFEHMVPVGNDLTAETAEMVSDSILEEASLLIGNDRTEDLRSKFRRSFRRSLQGGKFPWKIGRQHTFRVWTNS